MIFSSMKALNLMSFFCYACSAWKMDSDGYGDGDGDGDGDGNGDGDGDGDGDDGDDHGVFCLNHSQIQSIPQRNQGSHLVTVLAWIGCSLGMILAWIWPHLEMIEA